METLPKQFDAAVSNVTISDDKRVLAIAAHSEIRKLLESDATLKEWGVDSILIGSYARLTARHPGKDVDVFLRFKELSVRHSPEKVYDRVAEILVAEYGLVEEGGRATLQARSVKVDFAPPTAQADLGFSVDAVPAVPWGEHWGIPNRDRRAWDVDETRWVKTDPVEFADNTEKLSTSQTSPTVGDRNAYRPIVRLLRQVRHTHLGESRPGGLYVEIAAYNAWSGGRVEGDSWAELLAASLREVAVEFSEAVNDGMSDPVLKTPLAPALSANQWQFAADRFDGLATMAEQALESRECAAAKIWRDILGSNERGPVLPLPPGCGADGLPIAIASAVSAAGPSQARGFAAHSC